MRARVFYPVIVAVITAVSASSALAQTLSADEKELASYRLTMPTVRKVMAALQSLAEEAARDPKAQEMAKLKAEIKTLTDKDELTDAENAQLEKLQERVQKLEDEDDSNDAASLNNAHTLADLEAHVKSNPMWMRALTREGLTAREYARATMALLQAGLVEGFSQGKADLTKLPPGVNPDNVRFVRENKAELEAMQKTMAGKSKK